MQVRLQPDDLHAAQPAPVLPAVPAVLDVAGAAPEVADAGGPQPRLRAPPLADAEDDGPAARPQRPAHPRVGVPRVLALGVAPVVLQVVDPPRSIRPGVDLLVVLAAGTLLAGTGARVRVEPELQPLAVHVVRERL